MIPLCASSGGLRDVALERRAAAASRNAWDFTMEMICTQVYGERSALMIPYALTGRHDVVERRVPPVGIVRLRQSKRTGL